MLQGGKKGRGGATLQGGKEREGGGAGWREEEGRDSGREEGRKLSGGEVNNEMGDRWLRPK